MLWCTAQWGSKRRSFPQGGAASGWNIFLKVRRFLFLVFCNLSAGLFSPALLLTPGVCHNKAGKACPINLTVNLFFWAAAQIRCLRMFHINHGSEETIRHGEKVRRDSLSHAGDFLWGVHCTNALLNKGRILLSTRLTLPH